MNSLIMLTFILSALRSNTELMWESIEDQR